MTEDIDIFKCLDFIRDNSAAYSLAKAQRQYLENYRKTVKAQQMKLHLSLPVSAQEREAYASEEMQEIDKGIRAAMEDEVRLQWLLIAAQIKCEAWRSLQANARLEAKIV